MFIICLYAGISIRENEQWNGDVRGQFIALILANNILKVKAMIDHCQHVSIHAISQRVIYLLQVFFFDLVEEKLDIPKMALISRNQNRRQHQKRILMRKISRTFGKAA
jgi:hypothetical protein